MLLLLPGFFVRPYNSILLCLFDYVNNKIKEKQKNFEQKKENVCKRSLFPESNPIELANSYIIAYINL
jgi:hypothetical protein